MMKKDEVLKAIDLLQEICLSNIILLNGGGPMSDDSNYQIKIIPQKDSQDPRKQLDHDILTIAKILNLQNSDTSPRRRNTRPWYQLSSADKVPFIIISSPTYFERLIQANQTPQQATEEEMARKLIKNLHDFLLALKNKYDAMKQSVLFDESQLKLSQACETIIKDKIINEAVLDIDDKKQNRWVINDFDKFIELMKPHGTSLLNSKIYGSQAHLKIEEDLLLDKNVLAPMLAIIFKSDFIKRAVDDVITLKNSSLNMTIRELKADLLKLELYGGSSWPYTVKNVGNIEHLKMTFFNQLHNNKKCLLEFVSKIRHSEIPTNVSPPWDNNVPLEKNNEKKGGSGFWSSLKNAFTPSVPVKGKDANASTPASTKPR